MRMESYRKHDRQRRIFKKTRASIELTKTEVLEIKKGRKELRREMKKQKIYSKHEFELTASSMGLYFDKGKGLLLWLWLWNKGVLGALLGGMLLTFLALYGISLVTEMRGHFTINLSNSLVSQGFELSDTADFAHPTSRIYGTPVEDAPCISIADLPEDIDEIDGSHNGRNYFAHTFYLAKRGEGEADYNFSLCINSESLNVSKAIWVMLYEDGVPKVYAKVNEKTGKAECIPAKDNNHFGYVELPDGISAEQYEIIRQTNNRTYYRLIPENFIKEDIVAQNNVINVKEDEVHKYTVVIWLEGDDPDCTNDLIGGHVGMHMDFELLETK